MNADEIKAIQSDANMIVSGYAFLKKENASIQVIQLETPFHAFDRQRIAHYPRVHQGQLQGNVY